MWIVAIGSIDLGHRFVGPFNTEDQAQEWLDELPERAYKTATKWPIQLVDEAYALSLFQRVDGEFDVRYGPISEDK